MQQYYCKCEDCKYAKFKRVGDGWHEPLEWDFSCLKEGEVTDDEWTDNPNDTLCPDYEHQDKGDDYYDNL